MRAAAVALACWLAAACSPPAVVPGGATGADLKALLEPDGATAAGGGYRPQFGVTRDGRRLESAVLVAPAAVKAPLAGIEGRATLDLMAAPVFNIGDGFEMEILLSWPGGTRSLYTRYFDPGRCNADRSWLRILHPVDLGTGRGRALEIRISAGPQGDLVDDWLALASIRVTAGAR